jgi:hypothetical protein
VSTTALFAELLVGGLQTLVWLTLLVMIVLGPSVLGFLGEAPSFSVIGVLAIAYPLGVLFDRVWDLLLKLLLIERWVEKRAKRSAGVKVLNGEDEFLATRRMILQSDPRVPVDVIHYNRSRMRVARASMFNILLITITGLLLAVVHFQHMRIIVLIVLVGLLLLSASAVAYYDLKKSYYVFMKLLSAP